MSLVGYARVSTTEGHQVLDRQLDALNAAGYERVFEDHAASAAAKSTSSTGSGAAPTSSTSAASDSGSSEGLFVRLR